MIENINGFLGTVARTPLAKAARRSAGNVWNAHLAAFETTRHEARKVIELAIKEGRKISERTRSRTDSVVENLAGAADDQLSAFEQAMQQGASRVIRRIGLPTAKDLSALSRRVESLATRVESRVRASGKRGRRRAGRRAA